MDITSFLLGYKKGIASGSGAAVDPVHTVTFMSWDGSEVIGQRSVVDGDDCADMVARGKWEAPTRDSTVQYNYTYSGWSSTSGGAASSSALSAVTEDRTVYAAYTSSVRYYTITYYDGDTVLKTESKPYGSTLEYKPTKDGFSFVGWSPELAMVTGDTSYYAVWQEKLTFAGASWADIARVSEAGEAKNHFQVGDRRTETIDGITVVLAIAGFDSDRYQKDGVYVTAGITIISDLYGSTRTFKTKSGVTKYTDTEEKAYYDTLYTKFPAELKSVIKQVKKDYIVNSNQTIAYLRCSTYDAYVWQPSFGEVYTKGAADSYIKDETYKTSGYELGNVDWTFVLTGTASGVVNWWTRTPKATGQYEYWTTIGYSGPKQGSYQNPQHIRFGFCI